MWGGRQDRGAGGGEARSHTSGLHAEAEGRGRRAQREPAAWRAARPRPTGLGHLSSLASHSPPPCTPGPDRTKGGKRDDAPGHSAHLVNTHSGQRFLNQCGASATLHHGTENNLTTGLLTQMSFEDFLKHWQDGRNHPARTEDQRGSQGDTPPSYFHPESVC